MPPFQGCLGRAVTGGLEHKVGKEVQNCLDLVSHIPWRYEYKLEVRRPLIPFRVHKETFPFVPRRGWVNVRVSQ